MKRAFILLALVTPTSALAQHQQTDPDFLQRVLPEVQSQRNVVMDQLAISGMSITKLKEELAAAKARIKELETPKEQK